MFYLNPLLAEDSHEISSLIFSENKPGPVAQLVARLTQEPEVPGSILGPAPYFCFSFG